MIANQIKENTAEASAIVEGPVAVKSEIEVEVFESFEKAAFLEAEWDILAETVASEIFITYDWCRIWWKHYGKNRTLRIYTFRHNKILVGILPVFYEVIWLWPSYAGVIKIIGTDFTVSQLCLPIQAEYLPKVMESFFTQVNSAFHWDIIFLGPIAGQYRDLGLLYQTCCNVFGKRHCVEMKNDKVQTYFDLAPNWEKYLASLNKKERHEVERTYKLLSKTLKTQDSIVIKAAQKDSLDDMFTNFVQMHQLQWQRIKKLGHFGDWPGAEAFHREAAHANIIHDRLRLFEVTVGKECLGYEYVYKCGNKYFNFLAARSLAEQTAGVSLGKITIGEMVKTAISENVNCIDSLQGRYEYKLRLGGKLFPIHKILITRKDLSARLRLTIFRLLARGINFFYYRIWFCRLAKLLPLKRGPLWKKWIKTRELI